MRPTIEALPNEAEIAKRWRRIRFRDDAAGRRAYLVDGVQVWCIISALRYDTPEAIAEQHWTTIEDIKLARAFYAAEPAAAAQIDALLSMRDR